MRHTRLIANLVFAHLFACTSSTAPTPSRTAGRTAEAAGVTAPPAPDAGAPAPSNPANGNPSQPLIVGPSGGRASTMMPDAGPASAEVCDGKDNDQDGIIDNLDVNNDGVCDCLRIGTLGEIGPWSDGGNVLKSWLNARSSTPAVELGDQTITADLLKGIQVVVVLYVADTSLTWMNRTLAPHHTFSASEVEALRSWVNQGGGLFTTVGYLSDPTQDVANVNRLLAPFGVSYSATTPGPVGPIQHWESHPVTQGVMVVGLHNGAEPQGDAATALAHDDQGRVSLRARPFGMGHVLAYADEWITYDSEWKDSKDQQVERLWVNSFKWLTPTMICQPPPI